MVLRRVSLVLSGKDLETLLEGLLGEEACLSRVQGACVAGLELSRLLSRRAELLRLQGGLVEAFAAGVDPEAGDGEARPKSPKSASAAVSAASGEVESRPVSPVAPERWLSAVEVAVPVSVWQALREKVSEAEGVLRSLMGDGRLDRLWAHDFLSGVEALRRKWVLSPPVVSAVDEEVDVVRDSCPGCGLAFERPRALASGSLCPVCVEERARGDQA